MAPHGPLWGGSSVITEIGPFFVTRCYIFTGMWNPHQLILESREEAVTDRVARSRASESIFKVRSSSLGAIRFPQVTAFDPLLLIMQGYRSCGESTWVLQAPLQRFALNLWEARSCSMILSPGSSWVKGLTYPSAFTMDMFGIFLLAKKREQYSF